MSISQNDIIYFILTDRFFGIRNPGFESRIDKSNPYKYHGGNFDGIIEKIPYLKKLGITALWISPVYLQIDLNNIDGYHGYWALDFNAVNPSLYVDNGQYDKGSKKYLKDLVDKLHENGIKLILDMVVNHTGYAHPSLNDNENPTPIRKNWFNSPILSAEQDEIEGQLASLPDLNLDLPDVCDYHIKTIVSWITETGIDAIRMDTVKHIERDFWNYYKTQIKGVFPEISLIGEVLVYDVEILSTYQKNWAFNELFDFPIQKEICNVFINDMSMTRFVSPLNAGNGILEKDKAYTNHNRLVTLLDNHDLSARFFTSILEKQQYDYQKARKIMNLALSFLFTIRGIPQLYYGTEIGLEGHHDPDNRRDFPWEIINAENEVKNEFKYQKELFELSCTLINLRKSKIALTAGMFVCLYVDNFIIVYLRYVLDDIVIVAIHNGWLPMPDEIDISIIRNDHIPERIKELLNNKTLKSIFNENKCVISEGGFRIKLDMKTAEIYI
jgi:alpha-amylase